jgi:cell wall-associated NlpC family hydrolase
VSGTWRWAVAALAIPPVPVIAIAMTAGASGATAAASPAAPVTACSGPPVQPGKPVDGMTLTAAQVGEAQVIYGISATMRLPQRAAVIAIATAMQVSRLRNLPDGPGDAIGLFQQRPSKGWGTPAQIRDPVHAATRFYQALITVPGWQSLPLADAAEAVQHSGQPARYAKWEKLATDLAGTFSGTAAACLTDNNHSLPATGTTRLPADFTLSPGTPRQVVTAISYARAQLGKPYLWGGTGPAGYDCSGLVMMAYHAAGISLPRTTFQQVHAGSPVYSLAQLRPGDLIFAPGSDGTPDHPGHVGMYLGGGQVIEAPQTGKNVMIVPLSGYWFQHATALRRII